MSNQRLQQAIEDGDSPTFYIRSAYDSRNLEFETGLECKEPTLTIQSEKDSCDINFILDRYAKSQAPPIFQYGKEGFYADITNIPDYQEAMNRITYTEQYFDQLPSRIKKQFENNPANLLDFLADPANNEQAIALGLRPKPSTEAAPTAPIPPDPVAPPTGGSTPPAE